MLLLLHIVGLTCIEVVGLTCICSTAPPPQMLGLNNVPQAGDEFTVYETEADARVAGVYVG